MRIIFIGGLNSFENPRGGEEYKNQLIVQELCRHYEVKIFDTNNWVKRPFLLLKMMFFVFFSRTDKIILSAASKSSDRFIRALGNFPKIRRKIVYVVVGGYFSEAISHRTYKAEHYKGLSAIIVQSAVYRDNLNLEGIDNVYFIPNFKKIPVGIITKSKVYSEEKIRFVFLSNISEEKGVKLIIQASNLLSELSYIGRYEIDFYGYVTPTFKEIFSDSLNDNLRYMGYFDFRNEPSISYQTLANYDCMLFPTKYIGEGFPGVLLDAFISGLPVIASDWHINSEIIHNNINGFLIKPDSVIDLADMMRSVIDNPNRLVEMSKKSKQNAELYSFESAWVQVETILRMNLYEQTLGIKTTRGLAVLYIGGTNVTSKPVGGEEFKNQIFFSKLSECYNCKLIDTIKWKRKPDVWFKILTHLFLKKFDSIIISASSLSAFRLIKLLSFFPNIIKKTNYFVIGGYFPQGLNEGVYKYKYYKDLNKIVVEGEVLRNEIISNTPLHNVVVVPNFKKFDFIPQRKHNHDQMINFVFISLISADKGCDIILSAVKQLMTNGLGDKFSVSFYGEIESWYSEKFLGQIGDNIYYKGYLDLMSNPNEAYAELSNYDCLLFPSYFKGEGFPGVLIDSFIAGLPTIASDWNMNTELVINEKNGIVVPVKNEGELARAMQRIIENPEMLDEMSVNALNCASNYHIDSVWPRIQSIIEN